MIALLLAHLAMLVLVAGLRFAHALDVVLGFPLSIERWAMLSGVLVSLAAIALRREIVEGRAPWSSRERAVLWMVLVGAPLLVWSFGDAEATLGVDLVVLILAGLLGWITVLGRPAARTRGFWVGGPRRWWVALTLLTGGVMIALLLRDPSQPHTAWPWLTYPFYALLQLGLLLELPERHWREHGVGRAARVAGVSVLFAMIHGPNPVVLVLTAMGMAVWALARTAGVGLVPLALSMGLLGATVARTLPPDETQNMRVGPGYVIKRERARELASYVERVRSLAGEATVARGGGSLVGWLELVHHEVFGWPIDAPTRDAWRDLVAARVRAQVVRITLESEEYRQRHGIERLMVGPDRSLLYSTFQPWHPAQSVYAELVVRAEPGVPTEDHASFVRHVYEVLQRRTPAPEELAGWDPLPDHDGRVEIVRRFLLEAGVADPGYWHNPGPEIEWPGGSSPSRTRVGAALPDR